MMFPQSMTNSFSTVLFLHPAGQGYEFASERLLGIQSSDPIDRRQIQAYR